MPELPEVETMVERLQAVVGLRLAEVVCYHDQDPKRYNEAKFDDDPIKPPPLITGVHRRGKFIVFMLDNNLALLCHNAMSGYWDNVEEPWTFDYVEGNRTAGENDVRALLKLWSGPNEDGTIDISVWRFHDARKFGSLKIITPEALAEKLSKLGPEADHTTWMYEPAELMTPVKFVELIGGWKRSVKEFLMEQSQIAGVGNIYASEACFHAQISPLRPGHELNEVEQLALFLSVRSVLRQAMERRLDYGGLKIYRRAFCPKCENKTTIQKIKGRTTYWCPICQR